MLAVISHTGIASAFVNLRLRVYSVQRKHCRLIRILQLKWVDMLAFSWLMGEALWGKACLVGEAWGLC